MTEIAEQHVEMMPLDELLKRHHPDNPKDHDIGGIIESIREFGFVRNVMLNETDGQMLFGHGTTNALDEMMQDDDALPERIQQRDDGMWLVPTDRGVALDLMKAKAYVVADNQHALAGGWNEPQLADNLIMLAKEEALAGTGFDGDDVDRWVRMYRPELLEGEEGPVPKVDQAAELLIEWGVKTGDIWKAGSHTIMCGDSSKLDDIDRLLNGATPIMALTSPPYCVGRDYEIDMSYADLLGVVEAMGSHLMKRLPPGGYIFWNFGDIHAQTHAKGLTGEEEPCIWLTSVDYWRIFREQGWLLSAHRIWIKPYGALPMPWWSMQTNIPHHGEWEHLWTLRKPGGEPKQKSTKKSKRAVWSTAENEEIENIRAFHTAGFPVVLPRWALEVYSQRNESVIDPFLGSASTMIACEQMERICYGMEIEPSFVAVALERLKEIGLEPELQ